ncbi:hypothetical protein [Streptomyces sp. NPDC003832]
MLSGLPVRVHVVSALIVAVWVAGGGCIGLLWGGLGWALATAVASGLAACAGMTLFIRRTATSVRAEQERHRREADDQGTAEGHADAVLVALTLYSASVFPIVPRSVSAEEQQARRTIAYRMSAYDGLPRDVRLSAAEVLETVDDGSDAEAARAALRALSVMVYHHRLSSR